LRSGGFPNVATEMWLRHGGGTVKNIPKINVKSKNLKKS